MNLFLRKIIGWHIATNHNVELMVSVFNKTYKHRHVQYRLIFHSDQGFKYTAFAFRNLLDSCNVIQTFSKNGYPFDNTCCKNFFKYLKKNRTNRRTYHTVNELRLDIFEYIENLYNNRLPHSTIGYQT